MNTTDKHTFVNDLIKIKDNTDILIKDFQELRGGFESIDRRGLKNKYISDPDNLEAALCRYLEEAVLPVLCDHERKVFDVWNGVLLIYENSESFEPLIDLANDVRGCYDIVRHSVTAAINDGHFQGANYLEFISTVDKMFKIIVDKIQSISIPVNEYLDTDECQQVLGDLRILDIIETRAAGRGMDPEAYLVEALEKDFLLRVCLYFQLIQIMVCFNVRCDVTQFSGVYDEMLRQIYDKAQAMSNYKNNAK